MTCVCALLPADHIATLGLDVTGWPLNGLNARLFIHAQYHSVQWWVQVQAHHVGGFGCEVLVFAYAPTAVPLQVDALPLKDPPDRVNAGSKPLRYGGTIPV